jgi:hypothetical protein
MTAIDAYVADLASRLRVGRRTRATLLDEVRDHLTDSAEHAIAAGSTHDRAETDAVDAFGSTALVARQFNAAAGVRAMRRAPLIAIVAGSSVVAGFLAAAIPQPTTTQQATPPMQVTFFFAVLALQVAITAGACGASRVLAVWRSSATSGYHRAFVRRCTIISVAALAGGVMSLIVNFVLDLRQAPHAEGAALAAGAAVMILAAATGLVTALRLQVNAADNDTEAHNAESPRLYRVGEATIAVVHRYPITSCAIVTLAAAAWAMSHAEAPSFLAALPWGIAEALAVVVAFVALGPILGLRPTPGHLAP